MIPRFHEVFQKVIGGITGMVVETVVTKAVPKLMAMFIPGAGFISAIISIYDTVMVFVEKISKIIQVVTGFINSIVAIAAGNIGAAAAKVESVLAGLISLAISFLAGFVGLGKVADKVRGVIQKVQAVVDKAIDAAIGWMVAKAKGLFGRLFGKEGKGDEKTPDVREAAGSALAEKLGSEATAEETEQAAQQVVTALKPDGLNKIYLGPENADGDRPVFAEASPPKRIRVLARKKIIVAIQATVTVTGEPVLSGLAGARFSKFDRERATAIGGTGSAAVLPEVAQPPGTPGKRGSQPSSGLVIQPEPESRQLEVVAWNTRAPEKGHNVSHAERQFINWFDGQSQKWKQRVKSVNAVVFGRAICELCASDIQAMKSRYQHIAFNWNSGDSGSKSAKEEKRELKS